MGVMRIAALDKRRKRRTFPRRVMSAREARSALWLLLRARFPALYAARYEIPNLPTIVGDIAFRPTSLSREIDA